MPSKRDYKAFGLGLSAAFIVGSLWPSIKDGVRPVTKAMVKGLVTSGERIRTFSAQLQEEIEDAVAEVQFERAQSEAPTEESPVPPRTTSTNEENYTQ